MVKIEKIWKGILVFITVFCLSISSQAQIGQNKEEAEAGSGGPRRQLATIIFSGLGGAVLGLSTLSFVDRPQDRLVNIAVGFAIGVIIGTVYVTYRAASEPDKFYSTDLDPLLLPKNNLIPDFERIKLVHQEPKQMELVNLSFSF